MRAIHFRRRIELRSGENIIRSDVSMDGTDYADESRQKREWKRNGDGRWRPTTPRKTARNVEDS